MEPRTDSRALEFNVGAMTLLALGFFGWLILFVGDVNPLGNEYALYADFDEIQLLQKGDPIRKNGMIIGKVDAFRFVKNKVRVTFRIEGNFKIRKDALVAVGNVGLFGANYIKVTEPNLEEGKVDPGAYPPGTVISGRKAPEFETLLNEGNLLLGDLRATVRSLTSILDDSELRKMLKDTVTEIRDAAAAGRRTLETVEGSVEKISGRTEDAVLAARNLIDGEGGIQEALKKLGGIMDEVEGIAKDNRWRLRRTTHAVMKIVEDLEKRAFAAKLTDAADQMGSFGRELNGFLRELNKNGQTTDKIRKIAGRVETITSNLAEMTTDTKEALDDSNLKGSLKSAFNDVHTIAGRVDELGSTLSEIQANVVAGLFYSDQADDFRPELHATLQSGDRGFFRVGAEDIGGDDHLNLQLGRSLDSKSDLRLGIVADEFGIGYDRYLFRKSVQVRLELYNPDDLAFRYSARFKVMPDFFVSFRSQDLGPQRGRTSYLGLEKRF